MEPRHYRADDVRQYVRVTSMSRSGSGVTVCEAITLVRSVCLYEAAPGLRARPVCAGGVRAVGVVG